MYWDIMYVYIIIIGARSKIGRAPNWLRKPAAAAFGFGGKLVIVGNNIADGKSKQKYKFETINLVENFALLRACDKFHSASATGNLLGFCDFKANSC